MSRILISNQSKDSTIKYSTPAALTAAAEASNLRATFLTF
jgi:hypothetical protein